MSTQLRPSNTRSASKRRAAARRRNREMLRRVGAIFFVLLFVLGTVTTLFVFQTTASTTPATTTSGSIAPAAVTVAPAGSGNAILLTPAANASGAQPTAGTVAVTDLVKKAQDAGTAGDWTSAISFYKSALGLTNGNASIEYELGKAYIQTKQYDLAVNHLQNAVNLNPDATFAGDAKSLISQYQAQATAGASSGAAATSAPTSAATPSK